MPSTLTRWRKRDETDENERKLETVEEEKEIRNENEKTITKKRNGMMKALYTFRHFLLPTLGRDRRIAVLFKVVENEGEDEEEKV